MKTSISLPNELSHMAAKYAEKHGLSINQLCATAVSEFIKKDAKKREKEDHSEN